MPLNEDNIMEWLKERVGEDDYAEVDEFMGGYMRENREYRESSAARIGEYETAEAAMKEDIQSLKARNYDLLMQVPASDDAHVVDEVEDDGTVYHIDSLFIDKEEPRNGNKER